MKRRRHALIPSTLSVPRSTTSSTVPSMWRPQYPARPHLSGLPTCRSTCPSWTRGRPRRSPAHHVRQSIIQGSHSPPWSRCRHRLPRRTMIPTIISSHSWILVAAASRTTAVRVPWGQRYLPIQQWHTYQIIFNTNSRILTPLRRGYQRHSSSSVTVTSSLCQNYRLWTLLAMRTCSRPHKVSVSDHSFLPHRFCCCSLLLSSSLETPTPRPTNACSSNGVSLSLVYLLYILALLDSALYHLSHTYFVCLYTIALLTRIQFICIYLPLSYLSCDDKNGAVMFFFFFF